MIGSIIMSIGAFSMLSTPISVDNSFVVPDVIVPSLTMSISNADYSRTISNATANTLIFSNQYFRSDVGSPLSITVSSAPNPVIPGTHIPIYKISALIDGGMNIESVMEDYPSLTREQIESSSAYARANPYSGPPYPKTTFKRALRKMDFYKYLSS